jgi:hypothetical protein
MQTIPDSKPHDKRHARCVPSNGIRHPFHTLMEINYNPPCPFSFSKYMNTQLLKKLCLILVISSLASCGTTSLQQFLNQGKMGMEERFDLVSVNSFIKEVLKENTEVNGTNISMLSIGGHWLMTKEDYPNKLRNRKWILDDSKKTITFTLSHELSGKRIVIITAKRIRREKFKISDISIGYIAKT